MIHKFIKAIDLQDNPEAWQSYEHYHQPGNVPTDVLQSICAEGFISMEIYRVDNRLIMIAEIDDTAIASKNGDASVVAQWDKTMNQLQHPLPGHNSWCDMQQVFNLKEHIQSTEEN